MPHRTTYFFPRQFPDRGFDASTVTPFEAHEDQIRGNFNGDESDRKATDKKGGKSNGFTGDRIHGMQLGAFVNWLADRKGERRSGHVKVRLDDDGDGDHEFLLQPEPPESVVAVESQGFDLDQTVSFQRLSSGTRGYNGGKERQAASSASAQGLSSGSSSSYCGPAKERRFERQTSPFQGFSGGGGGYCGPAKERRLERQASSSLQGLLSSGSSYGGSLFSGTTAEGGSSSGVKDSRTTREREFGGENEGELLFAARTGQASQ